MKELIFDLQLFEGETKVAKFEAGATGVVIYKDADGNSLFQISGIKNDDISKFTYNGTTHITTVDKDAFNNKEVAIKKLSSDEEDKNTYTLTCETPTETKSWLVNSKTASYRRDTYYAVENEGAKIAYHPQASNTAVVEIELTVAGLKHADLKDYLTVNEPTAPATTGGTIAVNSNKDGENTTYLAAGFEVKTDGYTITTSLKEPEIKDAKLNLTSAGSGTVEVRGDWTTGYYLNDKTTPKKITYSAEKKDQLLATITGLNKTNVAEIKDGEDNVTGVENLTLTATTKVIELKLDALTTATTPVKIVNKNDPNGTANTFKLALQGAEADARAAGDVPHKVVTTVGDTKTETLPAEKDIWEVSGTTATFKRVQPAYYTLADDQESVTYTKQANIGNAYGKITGLATNNTPAESTAIELVDGEDQKTLKLSYKAKEATTATTATAIVAATVEEGDGEDKKTYYTFTVNGNVLPIGTEGKVTLAESSNEGSKLVLGKALKNDKTELESSDITEGQTASEAAWELATGTATLKAKLSNGYLFTDDTNTVIKNEKAQTATAVELATITGLSDKVNGDANLTEYLTIEGYAADKKQGADENLSGDDGYGKITITLKKKALDENKVTLTNKTKSFTYELKLCDEGEDDKVLTTTAKDGKNAGTSSGTLPVETYRWDVKGTTAYYKRVVPAYYTIDDGKVIYHKQEDQDILATITGLKDGVATDEEGNLGVDVTTTTPAAEEGGEATTTTTFTKIIEVDPKKAMTAGSKITLDARLLDTNKVVLTNGKDGDTDSTYKLDIYTDDDANKVAQPDVLYKWWTVSDGTAELHKATQAGFKVEDNGTLLKYYDAVSDTTIASINNLSDKVKAIQSDGTELTAAEIKTKDDAIANAKTDDATKTAITEKQNLVKDSKLGILAVAKDDANGIAGSAEVVANNVSDEKGDDGKYVITLTDAMLKEAKVTLKDKNLNDDDKFKIALSENGEGDPATKTQVAYSWNVGGDAKATTLTYQKYNKGYYTLDEDKTTLIFNKDGAKTKLFTVSVNNNANIKAATLSDKDEADKYYYDTTSLTPTTLKYNQKDFLTVNDDETITIKKDAVDATTADNNFTLKIFDDEYKDYTFSEVEKKANGNSNMVTWQAPAWSVGDDNVVKLTKTPATDKNGYELSGDSQTLTYRSAETPLLQLTGLKSKDDLEGTDASKKDDWKKKFVSYSDGVVTVGLDVLNENKVTLKSLDNEKYSLELDYDVRQKAESGYSWTVSTSDSKDSVVVKAVTQDYYTKEKEENNTLITYHKEVPETTLFTINGLKTDVITAAKDDVGDDKAFTVSDAEKISFTTDGTETKVSIDASLLPDADKAAVTLKGSGVKFDPNSFDAFEFNSAGTWTISEGVATLTMPEGNVTAGYKLSPDGQTLIRVKGAQTLLTISGLATPPSTADTDALKETFNKNLAKALAEAYDDSTKTVTLPKEVLGTASKIKLTANDTKNDSFKLALADDVLREAKDGYSWSDTDGSAAETKNVTLKEVTQAYWTPDQATNTTSFTFHKEAPKNTLFTLNGIADGVAAKITADKDANQNLNDDSNDFIVVNTDTDKKTVTLSEDILVHGAGKNDAAVTLKTTAGYTLAMGDLSDPEYNNYAWTAVAADTKSTLQAEASTAGYLLSDNNTKLTHVAQFKANGTDKEKHDFVEVSGVTGTLTNSSTGNAVYDDSEKTVTLTSDALDKSKVSIKSLNGDTYKLKLDEESVRQESKSGYSWTVSGEGEETRTVVAKAVTQEYYQVDDSNTLLSYSYKKEVPSSTLFTITGLNQSEVASVTDTDGDNIFGTELISFSGTGSDAKITIAEKLLPTTKDKEVKITGNTTYTFDDSVTAPVYTDSKAKFEKVAGDDVTSATLVITPDSPGWSLDDDKKTLTRVTATAEDKYTLTTLNGINKATTATDLDKGIEVNLDAKTLTLHKDVIENIKSIKADKASGYKLAVDSSEVQVGPKYQTGSSTERAEEDIWELVTKEGVTTAYRRTVYPEYYTVDNATSDTVSYHAAVKQKDLFSITGLKGTIAINEDGDIATAATSLNALVSIYPDSSNSATKIVSISKDALGTLGDAEVKIANSKNYKFELADGPSEVSSQKWAYDPSKGEITVTGVYSKAGYILSDDGQTIKAVTANAEKLLATISGLAKGLTDIDNADAAKESAAIANKFEFDADAKTITFKDESLFTNTKVSIADPDSGFFNYTMALDTSAVNTNTKKTGTNWVVSADGSVASYKNTTEAAYTLDTKTYKSITTTVQKNGTDIAKISGLKFATDTYEVTAGSEPYAFSLTPTAKGREDGKAAINDVVSIDETNKAFILNAGVLPAAADTASATIKVNTRDYKIVMGDDTSSFKTEPEYTTYKAEQKKDATTFTITSKRSEYYTLNDKADTLTFTPASEAFVMATLTGIKAPTDADKTATGDGSGSPAEVNGIKLDVSAGEISIPDSALNGSDVTLTTSQDYKLVLKDEQNTDAADKWAYDDTNGTAVYKNRTEAYYTLENNDKKIKHISAKDNKIYFTITGLRTGGDTVKADNIKFDDNDTVTLNAAALPATYNADTVVTIKKGNGGTTNYKLALDMPATTFYDADGEGHKEGDVRTMGKAVEDTAAFSISGSKVVYSAKIKAGYTVSASGDKITVADGTKDKEYFTITGLNVSGVEEGKNIGNYVSVDANNIVTIKKEVLGTSTVSINNSDYSLALDVAVPVTNEVMSEVVVSGTTLSVKSGESKFYSINDKGNIIYHAPQNAKVLATVTGIKKDADASKFTVDLDAKTITIPTTKDADGKYFALGESNIALGTGKGEYTLVFAGVDHTSTENTWTVTSNTSVSTATLKTIGKGDAYKLSSDAKSIIYTADGAETEILKLSNLKTGLKADGAEKTGTVATTNYITGISVEKATGEDKATYTVKLDNDVLTDKNATISGQADANFKIAFDDEQSTTATSAWAYSTSGKDANKTVTMTYKSTVPTHYELDATSTTAKYVAEKSTDLIKVSGNGFNSTIMDPTGDGDTAKANAAKTEFGKYITITPGEAKDEDADKAAVAPILTFKKDSNKYLLDETGGKSVTIATSGKDATSGLAYKLAVNTADVVKTTGDNKWAIKGSSLILSKATSAGYTLSGNKLSYTASDETGDKIFTINGLNLTAAKEAMALTAAQQTAAESTGKTNALAAVRANTSLSLTDDEKDTTKETLATLVATQPTKKSGATADETKEYNRALKIYNAYQTALKTATAAAVESKQIEKLTNYLNGKDYITIDDPVDGTSKVTIAKDVLGTSNISIQKNSGSTTYTLALGNDAADKQAEDYENVWSFSGGTATLKQTKDAYYTYDEKKNQILYNKPVYGETVATVKGLATKKVTNTTSDTYVQVASDVAVNNTAHTSTVTTTDTYTVHSNTQVVTLVGGEIGTVNITNTQLFTTTTVTVTYLQSDNTTTDATKTPKVTTTSKKSSITSGSPGAFTAGIVADDSNDVITLSKNVLGTSSVTLTNGKVGGETQTYSLEVSEANVAPETTNTKWTGSLGGTSAVFKGDISAGYTLENDENPTKITYSAAKNDAALLTVSGIKIPTTIVSGDDTITSATDSDTRNEAIATWLNSNVSIGSAEDGVAEVTVKAAALNEKDVTAKSGSTTTYTLVLDESESVADEATVYAWNGWNYQSYSSGYYSEVAKTGSIKYIKDGKATTLATVKGLKGKYDKSMGTGTELTIDAAHLGTGTVSVSGDGAEITLVLADDVATVYGDRGETGAWATNGTTASKRDGIPAHYTLVENVITYHKESGAKKTFATITGLKAGATVNDDDGVVKLTSEDLDKTTVKIANGKDAGDTNYTLTLASDIDGYSVETVSGAAYSDTWLTKGVNTTLKGNVNAGYDLSADHKSVVYTAAATGKALATFTFANSNTATATLTDKVIGLANGTGNKKITVKTNPYGLTIKPTGFSGTSTSDRVTLVGSGAADAFDISGLSNIALSGGAGDDLVSLGSTAKSGVSIGGGAGNDSIYGTGGTDLIILGDAGNDTINITGNAEKVNGGAGNDYLSVANAVSVLGDAGNDTINVTGKVSSVLSAGAGNDSVKVASADAIDIKGDAGNDHIEITGTANGTTIHGGAGNDTIKVAGSSSASVSVLGEAGNDVIEFKGNGTIYGGAGNDSIDVNGGTVTFFYASGDGSDSVTGWNDDDKFVLASGKIADKKASIGGANNEDLILTIGSGKVTLFGAGTGQKAGDEWTYYSGGTSDTQKQSIALVGGTSESGDIANDINSLIYEDNNLVTPNDISDLVSTNSITEYHVGNYDLTTPDQILPDSDNISYGNQQKKDNK